MNYITGSNEVITQQEMLDRIYSKIMYEKTQNNTVNLIIGCDSQVFGDEKVDNVVYATAIAVHIVGKGGIFFISKEKISETIHLSIRLFKEVSLALAEAEKLKDHGILDIINRIEIHIDVGYNGKSGTYAQALKGMIEGFGYQGFIKPESMAASVIADRYTK
jgi:predicted RNase H-related nuclease YkuK (DUF458 family)